MEKISQLELDVRSSQEQLAQRQQEINISKSEANSLRKQVEDQRKLLADSSQSVLKQLELTKQESETRMRMVEQYQQEV